MSDLYADELDGLALLIKKLNKLSPKLEKDSSISLGDIDIFDKNGDIIGTLVKQNSATGWILRTA